MKYNFATFSITTIVVVGSHGRDASRVRSRDTIVLRTEMLHEIVKNMDHSLLREPVPCTDTLNVQTFLHMDVVPALQEDFTKKPFWISSWLLTTMLLPLCWFQWLFASFVAGFLIIRYNELQCVQKLEMWPHLEVLYLQMWVVKDCCEISWIRVLPTSKDWYSLGGKDTQREESHVKMEAEMGVRLLQAKKYQGFPGASYSKSGKAG